MQQDSCSQPIPEKIGPVQPKFCNIFDGTCYSVLLLLIFFESDLTQVWKKNGILTWFDDLEIDVPEAAAAAEEMAGCEYIMSDLIGGKT